jgi:D-threo-aldose 1-dehydrogenase
VLEVLQLCRKDYEREVMGDMRRSKLKDILPEYGLGTAHVVQQGEKVAATTIEKAYEEGIRFFDTAPLYGTAGSDQGTGRSESVVGKALAGVPRESYILATKVGRRGETIFDFSRDGILASVEESLKRLKTDTLDILHIHDPDLAQWRPPSSQVPIYRQVLDEAYPVVAELRSQGVVKAIGVGMNQWEMLDDFARNGDFDCFLLAGRYTLLEQTSLNFLENCLARGIAVVLGGVFNSGILVRDLVPGVHYNYEAAPQEVLGRAQAIASLCQRHGVPLPVAALRFAALHPAVTSLVVGAESPAEVTQNLGMLSAKVPDQLWRDLKNGGLLENNAPVDLIPQ